MFIKSPSGGGSALVVNRSATEKQNANAATTKTQSTSETWIQNNPHLMVKNQLDLFC